jgi:hypothetical protein
MPKTLNYFDEILDGLLGFVVKIPSFFVKAAKSVVFSKCCRQLLLGYSW